MVKILILGAANDQVPLIEVAKELGYYIIVCDFTTTNPGLALVDKQYQVSYLDKEEVLKVAESECVDGVISNSEQAMPTVAYVSEKMGLVGNTVDSVLTLSDKTRFRELQKRVGLYTPKHIIVTSAEQAVAEIKVMNLPVLIKACECSASRGTFKIMEFDEENIRSKYNESESFSWNKSVAIEEFVEMPSLTTYEGDVFVQGDEFLWDGIFYAQRSPFCPMVPMTYVGPIEPENDKWASIKETFTTIFREAGIRHGQYNVEMFFTKEGLPFVIEVNTRQGGRSLPKFIKQYCGIDYTKLLVTTSVGDTTYFNELRTYKREIRHIAHHLLFSRKDGQYNGYELSDDLKGKNFLEELYKPMGEYVRETVNGTDAIGSVDFEFYDLEERNKYAFCIENNIRLIIK